MTDQSIVCRLNRRGGACPECGSPADPVFRPFCSKRCSEVDLGRWLRGDYRIPVDETPGDDDEA